MTELRDIESRLQNWAAWATASEGSRQAACMTAAVCDAMRRASGAEPSCSEPRRVIDSADAYLVSRAMIKVTFDQRRLLGLKYVDDQREGYIAALLRFPPLDFGRKLVEAQSAVEAVLDLL